MEIMQSLPCEAPISIYHLDPFIHVENLLTKILYRV